MDKRNFRGEPIHQQWFMDLVEKARDLLVGRAVIVRTEPVGQEDKGFCEEIAITPDYDSVDIVLTSGNRYGMQISEVATGWIDGPTDALSSQFARRIVKVDCDAYKLPEEIRQSIRREWNYASTLNQHMHAAKQALCWLLETQNIFYQDHDAVTNYGLLTGALAATANDADTFIDGFEKQVSKIWFGE